MERNKSVIGDGANNNNVFQGCKIDININATGFTSQAEIIKAIADKKDYSAIQTLAQTDFKAFEIYEKSHPLYPDYSAKFDSTVKRLVSTPQTEEAKKKYPKRIKETAQIDLKQFPGLDSSETLFDYAYRTQTPVNVPISSYQEFLGDDPDPFPYMEYAEGMGMIIYPPEFPEAVEMFIETNGFRLPVKFRRTPCQQFGIMTFTGTPVGHGIQVSIRYELKSKKISAKIKGTACLSIQEQLNTELFLQGFLKTKKISIIDIDNSPVKVLTSNKNTFNEKVYRDLPCIVRYLQSLLKIQEVTGCQFDWEYKDIPLSDYQLALTMEKSLNNEWAGFEESFNDETRCDFNNISPHIVESSNAEFENLVMDCSDVTINLLGKNFKADKYFVLFQHAKINNFQSVKKNYNKEKKGILITIKPRNGENFFKKFCKFENLSYREAI